MEITVLVLPVRGERVYLARKRTGAAAGYLSGWRDHFQPDDLFVEFTACRVMQEQGGVRAYPDDLEPACVINFFFDGKHRSRCYVYFLKKWLGDFARTSKMEKGEEYLISEIDYERLFPVDRVWMKKVFEGEVWFVGAVYHKTGLEGVPPFAVLEPFPRGLR